MHYSKAIFNNIFGGGIFLFALANREYISKNLRKTLLAILKGAALKVVLQILPLVAFLFKSESISSIHLSRKISDLLGVSTLALIWTYYAQFSNLSKRLLSEHINSVGVSVFIRVITLVALMKVSPEVIKENTFNLKIFVLVLYSILGVVFIIKRIIPLRENDDKNKMTKSKKVKKEPTYLDTIFMFGGAEMAFVELNSILQDPRLSNELKIHSCFNQGKEFIIGLAMATFMFCIIVYSEEKISHMKLPMIIKKGKDFFLIAIILVNMLMWAGHLEESVRNDRIAYSLGENRYFKMLFIMSVIMIPVYEKFQQILIVGGHIGLLMVSFLS